MNYQVLNAENRALVNRLLNEDGQTFQFLHNSLHFNFEKPFQIFPLRGFLSAEKLFQSLMNQTDKDDEKQIGLLLKNGMQYVCGIGKVMREAGANRIVAVPCHLSVFDFDVRRRKPFASAYAVVQNMADLGGNPTEKELNWKDRFYQDSACFSYKNHNYAHYLEHNLSIRLLPLNGEQLFSYSFSSVLKGYAETGDNTILDKSGYLVPQFKAELLFRLNAFKLEKENCYELQSINTANTQFNQCDAPRKQTHLSGSALFSPI